MLQFRCSALLALVSVALGGITVENPQGQIVERHDMGDPKLPPMILIPGIGGSMIQARIPGKRTDWECLVQQFFQKSWFDLWFDVTEIIPGSVGCFQVRPAPSRLPTPPRTRARTRAHAHAWFALAPRAFRRALRRPTSSSSGTCGGTNTSTQACRRASSSSATSAASAASCPRWSRRARSRRSIRNSPSTSRTPSATSRAPTCTARPTTGGRGRTTGPSPAAPSPSSRSSSRARCSSTTVARLSSSPRPRARPTRSGF